MFNFWENIARYPRFFISAMLGLTLIITTPFQGLLKSNTGKVIFIFGFISISVLITIVLKNMLGL